MIDGIYVVDTIAGGSSEGRKIITIPEGITEIHHGAFKGDSVEELYLSQSISNNNFGGHSSLKKITLSSSVTSFIGTYTFANCSET